MTTRTMVALKAPLRVHIALTSQCNHSCPHCLAGQSRDLRIGRVMTGSEIERLSAVLIEQEVFEAIISGGEPLLYMDEILQLLEALRPASIEVALNSNLALATVDSLRKLRHKGLRRVLTSLPSSREKRCDSMVGRRGGFGQICSGIRSSLMAGLETAVNLVVTPYTVGEIQETVRFIDAMGVGFIKVTLAIPPPTAPGTSAVDHVWSDGQMCEVAAAVLQLDAELIARVELVQSALPLCTLSDALRHALYGKAGCSGSCGVSSCCIDTDGSLRPCIGADISYGNVFSEPFADAWSRMSAWREGKAGNINEDCRDCSYLGPCSGECRVATMRAPRRYAKPKKLSLPSPRTSHLLPDPEPSQTLRMNQQVHLRREPFGMTFYHPEAGYGHLAHSHVAFLELIAAKPNMTFHELTSRHCESGPNLSSLLTLLRRKRVIDLGGHPVSKVQSAPPS